MRRKREFETFDKRSYDDDDDDNKNKMTTNARSKLKMWEDHCRKYKKMLLTDISGLIVNKYKYQYSWNCISTLMTSLSILIAAWSHLIESILLIHHFIFYATYFYKYYIILYHVILYYIILYHIILYHLIS